MDPRERPRVSGAYWFTAASPFVAVTFGLEGWKTLRRAPWIARAWVPSGGVSWGSLRAVRCGNAAVHCVCCARLRSAVLRRL